MTRITKDFEKVRQEVGFKGDLHAFFDYMRSSPRFQPKTREQLGNDFYALKKKVDAKVPQYFSQVPEDAARDPALSRLSREVRGRR